eukprot:2006331-Rhodomonas_salina.1
MYIFGGWDGGRNFGDLHRLARGEQELEWVELQATQGEGDAPSGRRGLCRSFCAVLTWVTPLPGTAAWSTAGGCICSEARTGRRVSSTTFRSSRRTRARGAWCLAEGRARWAAATTAASSPTILSSYPPSPRHIQTQRRAELLAAAADTASGSSCCSERFLMLEAGLLLVR